MSRTASLLALATVLALIPLAPASADGIPLMTGYADTLAGGLRIQIASADDALSEVPAWLPTESCCIPPIWDIGGPVLDLADEVGRIAEDLGRTRLGDALVDLDGYLKYLAMRYRNAPSIGLARDVLADLADAVALVRRTLTRVETTGY